MAPRLGPVYRGPLAPLGVCDHPRPTSLAPLALAVRTISDFVPSVYFHSVKDDLMDNTVLQYQDSWKSGV